MNDNAFEKEIQAKGLTAPRVTPAEIEANIAGTYYFTAAEGVKGHFGANHWKESNGSLDLLTFCVLELKNGFTVTGESACASPANFDAELGRKIARQNAVSKMWPLMGYALKQKLCEQENSFGAQLYQAAQEQTAALEKNATGISAGVTFQEFVNYGVRQGVPVIGGMPWSFQYNRYAVTHETDDCYLLMKGTDSLRFTRGQMLHVCEDGRIVVI